MDALYKKLLILNEKYTIASFYFSAVQNQDFINVLTKMMHQISYGDEYYGFNFPSAYEPEEDGYFEEGIEFYLNEKVEIMPINVYLEFLDFACKWYISNHPENELVVNKLLDSIKQIY